MLITHFPFAGTVVGNTQSQSPVPSESNTFSSLLEQISNESTPASSTTMFSGGAFGGAELKTGPAPIVPVPSTGVFGGAELKTGPAPIVPVPSTGVFGGAELKTGPAPIVPAPATGVFGGAELKTGPAPIVPVPSTALNDLSLIDEANLFNTDTLTNMLQASNAFYTRLSFQSTSLE